MSTARLPFTDWPFGDLISNHYGVILADPPWYFRNFSAKGEEKNPVAHYACMDLDAIKALPVADLARPDCLLAMWATAPMLPHALETVKAWGFNYCTLGGWAKRTRTDSTWQFGTGYRRRTALEPYILATRGKPPLLVRDIRNLIVAPVREHSRKPDQMRRDLERESPGPRCELFARERVEGWDAWGNEVPQ